MSFSRAAIVRRLERGSGDDRVTSLPASGIRVTVPLRTDSDVRTLRLWPAMVVCTHCGSDRVVPLSFPPPWREVRHLGQREIGPQPVIKCIRCGERSYVSIKAFRALSQG